MQVKKGDLVICVLALLNKQDRYGYELVQNISSHIKISEGSVYPLLRRLTKSGYLTTYLQESTEGPPRKYYHLTGSGREYLYELVEEWDEFTENVDQFIKGGIADE